jgi:hypothetical protein
MRMHRLAIRRSFGLKMGAVGLALASASSIAGLGSFAAFTDSTVGSRTDSTGTVDIALGAAGPANRLSVGTTDLAAGDTIQRAVNLINAGSLDLSLASLTVDATTSSLLDTDVTDGLQMVVDECSQAWTESAAPYTYTCGGVVTGVLGSQPVIGANLDLGSISALTAGNTDHLRVTLTLPSTAGNALQGKSSTLRFTFDAVQRTSASK